jgi:hypothetical protein
MTSTHTRQADAMLSDEPATRPSSTARTSRSTGWAIAAAGTAALAIAGVTAAVFLGFAAGPAHATTTPAAATVITQVSHTHAHTDGGGSHRGQHASTPTQQQVLRWETDLTTLDYDDGTLDGVMSAETHQSIRLLQADANLPQTGDMDAPTQVAMQKMLHGRS